MDLYVIIQYMVLAWSSYTWVNTSRVWMIWLTCYRQHYQMHFFEKRLYMFYQNFTQVCSYRDRITDIIRCKGLVQNRTQTITWNNDDQVSGCIISSRGMDMLKRKSMKCKWVRLPTRCDRWMHSGLAMGVWVITWHYSVECLQWCPWNSSASLHIYLEYFMSEGVIVIIVP